MRNLLIILLTIIFVICGCSSNSNNSEPPKIVLGQDPCDNCFMLINEKKFAASIWLSNGESKRFDDIGCMIDYVQKSGDKISSYWVYDYNNDKPLKAEEAYFVKSDKLLTPMSFGIVAFKTKSAASQYAAKYNTELIVFNDLIINNKISKMEK